MTRKAIAIKFQASENRQGGFQNIDAMITILLPLQFDFKHRYKNLSWTLSLSLFCYHLDATCSSGFLAHLWLCPVKFHFFLPVLVLYLKRAILKSKIHKY